MPTGLFQSKQSWKSRAIRKDKKKRRMAEINEYKKEQNDRALASADEAARQLYGMSHTTWDKLKRS